MSDFKYIYRCHKSLFTPTEIHFMKILEELAGDSFKVYGKVRIADILTPAVNKFQKGSGWHKMFSQISQKHVDYVLCDCDLKIICAIELNDPSHNRPDRIWRDEFVDSAFKSAGLPLVWVESDYYYNIEQVSNHIARVIVGDFSEQSNKTTSTPHPTSPHGSKSNLKLTNDSDHFKDSDKIKLGIIFLFIFSFILFIN
ncbi:hypothetical protein JCM30760_07840 [Thiomicrorhabdus hydrogeniphila]